MLPAVTQEKNQFQVPEGACDCHVHVFGPPDVYPYWSQRAYTPSDASEDDLLAMHRSIGITRQVIVHPSPYGTDNRRSQDAIAKIGANARGVAVIDENTTTLQELQRLDAAGFKGARLNLETSGVNNPDFAKNKLLKTAKLVAPFNWHVQIYSNVSVICGLKQSILECPVPVVLDHFARIPADLGFDQTGINDIFELMASGNVWMKVSAPQRISEQPDGPAMTNLARKLIQINPERLVWASDWPHSGAHPGVVRVKENIEPFHAIDDGHALNRFAHWAQEKSVIQKILVDNPAKLYQF